MGFHDLLTTNIAFASGPQSAPLRLLTRPALWPLVSQASALVAAYRGQVLSGIEPRPSFDQILGCPHLGNALAVALCVVDPDEHTLIAERQLGLAVGSGTYIVAATGSVSDTDLQHKNPIAAACAREAYQELAIEIPPQDVCLLDIVVAVEKLQPIAICVYQAKTSICELAMGAQFSQEANLEINRLLALDLNDLHTVLAAILRTNFAPTSRCVVWRLLEQKHGQAASKHYRAARRLWAAGWGSIAVRQWLNACVVWRR